MDVEWLPDFCWMCAARTGEEAATLDVDPDLQTNRTS